MEEVVTEDQYEHQKTFVAKSSCLSRKPQNVLRLLWFVWSANNAKVDESIRSELDRFSNLFALVNAICRPMSSWTCNMSVIRTHADKG